jgi:hypothetical protein
MLGSRLQVGLNSAAEDSLTPLSAAAADQERRGHSDSATRHQGARSQEAHHDSSLVWNVLVVSKKMLVWPV